MKHSIIPHLSPLILLTACILTGCSSLRQVQVIERVSRDTLYLNHIQYDSIYVDNWQLTDRSRDTIYVEKVRLEYKYKFLRDTIYRVQIDTIPVIKTVEVVKTERYTPAIYKWSLAICIALIILIVLSIVKKFFL